MLAYGNFQSNLMPKEEPLQGPQDDLLPQILSNPRRASKALAGLGVEKDQVEGLLKDARRASEVLASLIVANLQPFDENSAKDNGIQEQASRDPLVCVVGVGFVGEILLNVPTLLKADWSVDTRHLESAIDMVTSHARPGSTIVIESSVSVGMTRQLLGAYTDRYFCGMSPERVDPGRTVPAAHDIPKVISALTPKALERMQEVYSKTFRTVVPVSKPEVAEMTKLFENCYRMINITYVNEIADACQKANIDVNELVDAAATKPFGFQAFRPGLGVGGHCIPINPFYLMANNDLPATPQRDTGNLGQTLRDCSRILCCEEIGAPGRSAPNSGGGSLLQAGTEGCRLLAWSCVRVGTAGAWIQGFGFL
ncbi:UDP-N-acetyl-D-mannosamine 6-dehydrogenase [Hortaea werneckii]|nr:UDP-N-acetyl-D-mannosamine 6-dehydrogenase [Hortaea werneckii]KAI7023747.1 UDP-N-acetyl-D-mannosamine 6-dehydrogenase [Hortaea werneckii]KAI7674540.1 UDP-N-acetyl-D-mannosamine 6-dehydrogenase [Hortaea werneckii]